MEALIKKHEDFEKSLAAQEEKIKALDEFASKLIEGQHYAAEDVSQRRALLLQRRNALLEKSAMRRATLDAAFKLMQFERDCDETNGWIRGKLKFANDDSYLVSVIDIGFLFVERNKLAAMHGNLINIFVACAYQFRIPQT